MKLVAGTRRLACAAFVAGLLLVAPGCDRVKQALNPKPPPKPAAKAKPVPKLSALAIQRLRLLAKARLDQKLEQAPGYDRAAATKALLKEKYKINLEVLWPAGVPELGLETEEQVAAGLTKQLETEAEKTFPAAKRDTLKAEAAAKYPLYQVGDDLTVSLRAERTVTGKILKLDAVNITIGSRTVALADIVAPDPVSFDTAKTERLRDHYVKSGYDIPRREALKEDLKTRLPAAMREHYFIRVKDQWVRIDEFIRANVAATVEEQARAYNRELTQKLREEVAAELRAESRLPAGITITPPPDAGPARTPDYDD